MTISRPYVAAARVFTQLEAAEATAGAYRLAYDHLAATAGTLLATIDTWHTGHGTIDAYEHALADVRTALARDVQGFLTRPDITPCRCTFLGIGTPEHPRASLCLPDTGVPADETPQQTIAYLRQQLENERTSHQKTISNFTDFADSVATQASSVPPVRAQEDTAVLSLAEVRAGRSEMGPMRQLADGDPWAPLPAGYGPYETEQEAKAAPLPVAIGELFDAGLIEPGDESGLLANTVLAHLVAACEAAGIRRGAFDDRVLEWLAGASTGAVVQVVIGLLRRAFSAGAAAATIDQLAAALPQEADRG